MTAHVLLFALIALISSLVYHSLRVDSLKDAVVRGSWRFLQFFLLALVFGAGLLFFTRWL